MGRPAAQGVPRSPTCLSPPWAQCALALACSFPLCDDPTHPATSGGGNDGGRDKCLTPGPSLLSAEPEPPLSLLPNGLPTELHRTGPSLPQQAVLGSPCPQASCTHQRRCPGPSSAPGSFWFPPADPKCGRSGEDEASARHSQLLGHLTPASASPSTSLRGQRGQTRIPLRRHQPIHVVRGQPHLREGPSLSGTHGPGCAPDTKQGGQVGWSLLGGRRNVSSVTASPLSHHPLGTSGLSPPSHRKLSPSWRH